LRVLRRKHNMTQVEAAQRVGIRSEFVSEVERGNRGLRWHTLLAFLRVYGSSLAELAHEIEREAE
jgi:transcriptional regulator with XRE-family HTH domain